MASSIFLVLLTVGLHSDRAVHPQRTYSDEERAKRFVAEGNRTFDEIEIKSNVYETFLTDWDRAHPSPDYPRYDEEDITSAAYKEWQGRREAEEVRLSRIIFGTENAPLIDESRYYLVKIEHDPED